MAKNFHGYFNEGALIIIFLCFLILLLSHIMIKDGEGQDLRRNG